MKTERIYVMHDSIAAEPICAAKTMDEAIQKAIERLYLIDGICTSFNYDAEQTTIEYCTAQRYGGTITEEKGTITVTSIPLITRGNNSPLLF